MTVSYTIRPAKYAKGKVAIHCIPNGTGWKTLAARTLSEMAGVTYSNRERSYICSTRCAAKFVAEMAHKEASL